MHMRALFCVTCVLEFQIRPSISFDIYSLWRVEYFNSQMYKFIEGLNKIDAFYVYIEIKHHFELVMDTIYIFRNLYISIISSYPFWNPNVLSIYRVVSYLIHKCIIL